MSTIRPLGIQCCQRGGARGRDRRHRREPRFFRTGTRTPLEFAAPHGLLRSFLWRRSSLIPPVPELHRSQLKWTSNRGCSLSRLHRHKVRIPPFALEKWSTLMLILIIFGSGIGAIFFFPSNLTIPPIVPPPFPIKPLPTRANKPPPPPQERHPVPLA